MSVSRPLPFVNECPRALCLGILLAFVKTISFRIYIKLELVNKSRKSYVSHVGGVQQKLLITHFWLLTE